MFSIVTGLQKILKIKKKAIKLVDNKVDFEWHNSNVKIPHLQIGH